MTWKNFHSIVKWISMLHNAIIHKSMCTKARIHAHAGRKKKLLDKHRKWCPQVSLSGGVTAGLYFLLLPGFAVFPRRFPQCVPTGVHGWLGEAGRRWPLHSWENRSLPMNPGWQPVYVYFSSLGRQGGRLEEGAKIQTQKPPPEATRQPGPVWTSGSHSLAPCLCLDSCGWVEGQEGALWCPPDRLPINHLTVWPWANYSTSLCLGSSSKRGDKDSACLVGTLCVYTCIHICAKSLEPRLVPFTLSVNA